VAGKQQKDHASRTALWPIWFFGRYAVMVVLIYFISIFAFVGYAKWANPQPIAWADSMIDYYGRTDAAADPQMAMTLHDWVFIRSGLRAKMQANTGQSAFNERSRETLRLTTALWERGTVLFGLRLSILGHVLPAFALIVALFAFDGWTERSIRKACGGHESASVYHRAKKLSFYLLPPLAAIVFLCSPWAFDPVYLYLPVTLASAVLVRVQMTYYKKYL
jgi:Domain of unknown function (DUF4400)